MGYAQFTDVVLLQSLYKNLGKKKGRIKVSENKEVKKKKKIDKSQLVIKIMAFILALAMILPIVISGIYALKG